MKQEALFAPALPPGLSYTEEFLSRAEEEVLLAFVRSLPLQEAQYKQFKARRRTLSYGFGYDFTANKPLPAPALPVPLLDLRTRVAQWAGVPAQSFVQALITEYSPGTPLGWHRDVPEFETIAGISLLNECRLRLRPYPWAQSRRKQTLTVYLAPRSAYLLQGDVRWKWQHSVPPVKGLRYSITLRTQRGATRTMSPSSV